MNTDYEQRLHDAVQSAIAAIDQVIRDLSDGSRQEQEYLAAMVAIHFCNRWCLSCQTELLKRAILTPTPGQQ